MTKYPNTNENTAIKTQTQISTNGYRHTAGRNMAKGKVQKRLRGAISTVVCRSMTLSLHLLSGRLGNLVHGVCHMHEAQVRGTVEHWRMTRERKQVIENVNRGFCLRYCEATKCHETSTRKSLAKKDKKQAFLRISKHSRTRQQFTWFRGVIPGTKNICHVHDGTQQPVLYTLSNI